MSNDPTESENGEGNKIEANKINEINDKNINIGNLKENSDIFDFEPFLYSFEISLFTHSSSTTTTTLFDDRHHQDHAFGIIWILFSKQKKCPNIIQLHWSLKFLQKLKNNDGAYTRDVNKCIQMIQDNLIKQYAKLGNFLKDINKNIKDDENIFTTSTPKPTHVQEIFNIKMNRKLLEPTDKDFNFQLCGKSCGRGTILKDNASKIKSFTYDEMVSKGQLPCMEQVNYNYNLLFETYTSFDSIQKFIKDLNLSRTKLIFLANNNKVLFTEESVASINKKELLQFCNNIRNEYVETIKRQVDKIGNLENFMQIIDKKSFEAYITDDLVTFLNKLRDSDTEDNMEK